MDYIGFLSTCQKYLSLFSTIFSTKGATLTPSNGVIHYRISSGITTHPAQHPHLCYAYLILVFLTTQQFVPYNIVGLTVVQ